MTLPDERALNACERASEIEIRRAHILSHMGRIVQRFEEDAARYERQGDRGLAAQSREAAALWEEKIIERRAEWFGTATDEHPATGKGGR